MRYNIKDYSYDQAEKLNVVINPSTRGNYKIDVYKPNGDYITSIGNKNYSDFPTYILSHGLDYALERRRLYHLRHNKDKTHTRGFYSLNILW